MIVTYFRWGKKTKEDTLALAWALVAVACSVGGWWVGCDSGDQVELSVESWQAARAVRDCLARQDITFSEETVNTDDIPLTGFCGTEVI